MSNWIIFGIGFLAQALFGLRLGIQWILSERNKKVLTPTLFWKISLFAALLFFIYGYLRNDFAIMLGQTFTYFIYVRNIQLQKQWENAPRPLKWILWILPIILIIFFFNNNQPDWANLFSEKEIPFWLLILGICAQIIFNFRFIYQWIYSERKGESDLPLGFWLMSLMGSFLILIYAVFRLDPVLFIGQLAGSIIYFRNIYLIQKQYA